MHQEIKIIDYAILIDQNNEQIIIKDPFLIQGLLNSNICTIIIAYHTNHDPAQKLSTITDLNNQFVKINSWIRKIKIKPKSTNLKLLSKIYSNIYKE